MRRKTDKETIVCYVFFAAQLAVFILTWLFFVYGKNHAENIMLHSARSGFVLLAASFLIGFFSKRFTLEKKIIVMLGTTAIF